MWILFLISNLWLTQYDGAVVRGWLRWKALDLFVGGQPHVGQLVIELKN